MSFETLNSFSQSELLIFAFGFFLGVASRVGVEISNWVIKIIRKRIKKKKNKERLKKRLEKQKWLESLSNDDLIDIINGYDIK